MNKLDEYGIVLVDTLDPYYTYENILMMYSVRPRNYRKDKEYKKGIHDLIFLTGMKVESILHDNDALTLIKCV
jgi:hypothetical protein